MTSVMSYLEIFAVVSRSFRDAVRDRPRSPVIRIAKRSYVGNLRGERREESDLFLEQFRLARSPEAT